MYVSEGFIPALLKSFMEACLIDLLLFYTVHAKLECHLCAVTVRLAFTRLLSPSLPGIRKRVIPLSEQTWIYKQKIGGRNASSEKM